MSETATKNSAIRIERFAPEIVDGVPTAAHRRLQPGNQPRIPRRPAGGRRAEDPGGDRRRRRRHVHRRARRRGPRPVDPRRPAGRHLRGVPRDHQRGRRRAGAGAPDHLGDRQPDAPPPRHPAHRDDPGPGACQGSRHAAGRVDRLRGDHLRPVRLRPGHRTRELRAQGGPRRAAARGRDRQRRGGRPGRPEGPRGGHLRGRPRPDARLGRAQPLRPGLRRGPVGRLRIAQAGEEPACRPAPRRAGQPRRIRDLPVLRLEERSLHDGDPAAVRRRPARPAGNWSPTSAPTT